VKTCEGPPPVKCLTASAEYVAINTGTQYLVPYYRCDVKGSFTKSEIGSYASDSAVISPSRCAHSFETHAYAKTGDLEYNATVYEVILMFAEPVSHFGVGSRLFKIKVEDEYLKVDGQTNFDITKLAGGVLKPYVVATKVIHGFDPFYGAAGIKDCHYDVGRSCHRIGAL